MENKEIARCLYETADLMEIAGEDGFRIRSYRNGASAIESHPERVADILKNPDRKVTDIPGIGKGLAAMLFENFHITTMDELEKLCVEQKLRTLPRMGAKLEEKILRSIEQYRRSVGRFLLSFAEQTAEEITSY